MHMSKRSGEILQHQVQVVWSEPGLCCAGDVHQGLEDARRRPSRHPWHSSAQGIPRCNLL
jgi:hypothetical protein